eukprot:m.278201 g.278201  ORF g.278201 m.278201 type:complete len:67 (-) comp134908_c0_seq1:243-443(-)
MMALYVLQMWAYAISRARGYVEENQKKKEKESLVVVIVFHRDREWVKLGENINQQNKKTQSKSVDH